MKNPRVRYSSTLHCAGAALALILALATQAALAEHPLGPGLRMYTQDLTIDFASAEDAARARVQILPVLGGKMWAFSARWDDNSALDFPVHDLMVKYGLKGTFYLNSSVPAFGADAAHKLMAGGCSIGGHTQTHAWLPGLLPNEAFYEVLANRVQREAETDRPINSFAFPCGAYDSKIDPRVLKAVTQIVLRSGYHNSTYIDFARKNPELAPFEISTGHQVYPGDHQVNVAGFDGQIAAMEKLREARIKDTYCIHMGVHARQTGKELESLETIFRKYSGKADWWYCTMTEYAAYDRQFRNSRIETASPSAAVRQYRIARPVAAELGSDVPLTLEVRDASVNSFRPNGFECDQVSEQGRVLLNLHHAPSQSAPTRIDAIDNTSNAADRPSTASLADFPDLHAWLYCDLAANQLRLSVENGGTSPLTDVCITLRLPPQYLDGVRRLPSRTIATGEKCTIAAPLGELAPDAIQGGRAYFVAEVDFRRADEPARLFATTRLAAESPVSPCLRDAARMCGPFAEGELSLESLSDSSRPGDKLIDPGVTANKHWFVASEPDRQRVSSDRAMLYWKNRAWSQAAAKLDYKPQCYLVALDFSLSQAAKLKLITEAKPVGILLNGRSVAASNAIEGAVAGNNRLILTLLCSDGRAAWGSFPLFIRLEPAAGTLTYEVAPPQH